MCLSALALLEKTSETTNTASVDVMILRIVLMFMVLMFRFRVRVPSVNRFEVYPMITQVLIFSRESTVGVKNGVYAD